MIAKEPLAAGIDKLLHEPGRLRIAALLYAVASADFLFLLHESGLTKGNLPFHLAKLEEAGYVGIEKAYRGKVPMTVCHLSERGREAFRAYREQLRRLVQALPR